MTSQSTQRTSHDTTFQNYVVVILIWKTRNPMACLGPLTWKSSVLAEFISAHRNETFSAPIKCHVPYGIICVTYIHASYLPYY